MLLIGFVAFVAISGTVALIAAPDLRRLPSAIVTAAIIAGVIVGVAVTWMIWTSQMIARLERNSPGSTGFRMRGLPQTAVAVGQLGGTDLVRGRYYALLTSSGIEIWSGVLTTRVLTIPYSMIESASMSAFAIMSGTRANSPSYVFPAGVELTIDHPDGPVIVPLVPFDAFNQENDELATRFADELDARASVTWVDAPET
jgi:hypothetical protein